MLLMRLGCFFVCKYCSGFCMSGVVSTWVCFWGLCEYFAVILLRRNEVVCIWVLLLRFERFCLLNISLAFAWGRCIYGQGGGKLHEMQLFRNYQEDTPFAAQELILRPIFANWSGMLSPSKPLSYEHCYPYPQDNIIHKDLHHHNKIFQLMRKTRE